MSAALTCWSCREWDRRGCQLRRPVFPAGGPGWCDDFAYEPGADEAERDAD